MPLEVFAPYRVDPLLQAHGQNLVGDARDHGYPTFPAGVVPAAWLENRAVGDASLAGDHVIIGADETLGWLQHQAPMLPVQHGLNGFDGATIRQTSVRSFTQALSRWLYEQDSQRGAFVGIEFESRHGDGLTLWATFERSNDGDTSRHLDDMQHTPLDRDDPDLQRALRRHQLRIAGAR